MSVSQKASPLQGMAIRKVLQVLVPSKCWDMPQDSSVALVPLALMDREPLADANLPDVSALRSSMQALMDIELEVFLFFLARCP